jgi:hypothetical protein
MDIAQEVFKKENLLDFWPSDRQTGKERVEATTRFIVYAVALLFFIRRDGRVVLLGALVLAVLYGLYFNNMIPDGARSVYVSRGVAGLTMPSVENPMGNVLMGEYSSDPNRAPAAWYPSVREEVQADFAAIHPFEKARDYERNFYTTASTTIPNDQAAFAQAAYGRPFAPQCRDTPGACDPEGNPNSTFPERTQMRGGAGGGYGGSR